MGTIVGNDKRVFNYGFEGFRATTFLMLCGFISIKAKSKKILQTFLSGQKNTAARTKYAFIGTARLLNIHHFATRWHKLKVMHNISASRFN